MMAMTNAVRPPTPSSAHVGPLRRRQSQGEPIASEPTHSAEQHRAPRDMASMLPIVLAFRWAIEEGRGFFRAGDLRLHEGHLPEANGADVESTYFFDESDAAAASGELASIASFLTAHRGARRVHLTPGGTTPDPARGSAMSGWHWEIVHEDPNVIQLWLGPQHVLTLGRDDLNRVARDAPELGRCGHDAARSVRPSFAPLTHGET